MSLIFLKRITNITQQNKIKTENKTLGSEKQAAAARSHQRRGLEAEPLCL